MLLPLLLLGAAFAALAAGKLRRSRSIHRLRRKAARAAAAAAVMTTIFWWLGRASRRRRLCFWRTVRTSFPRVCQRTKRAVQIGIAFSSCRTQSTAGRSRKRLMSPLKISLRGTSSLSRTPKTSAQECSRSGATRTAPGTNRRDCSATKCSTCSSSMRVADCRPRRLLPFGSLKKRPRLPHPAATKAARTRRRRRQRKNLPQPPQAARVALVPSLLFPDQPVQGRAPAAALAAAAAALRQLMHQRPLQSVVMAKRAKPLSCCVPWRAVCRATTSTCLNMT